MSLVIGLDAPRPVLRAYVHARVRVLVCAVVRLTDRDRNVIRVANTPRCAVLVGVRLIVLVAVRVRVLVMVLVRLMFVFLV